MPAIENRLAYLGFQLIEPCAALRPFVAHYWLMLREKSLESPREEFMHALGGFGIVFNLGDVVSLNEEPLTAPVFLDGANSQSRRMRFTGKIALLGIRFREGAAYPFIGVPLAEANNQTELLALAGEDSLMPLYEGLQKLLLSAQIQAIENWLLQRLASAKTPDYQLVSSSLKLIRQGVPSMEELAQSLNIGQRQLERIYQQQVGLSPKAYSRLLRIDKARQSLKQPQNSLTDLGLSLGFYDQSHFIREFKAVIGMTPSAYIEHSSRYAQVNVLPDMIFPSANPPQNSG